MKSYSNDIVDMQQFSHELTKTTEIQNALILSKFDELSSNIKTVLLVLIASVTINIAGLVYQVLSK